MPCRHRSRSTPTASFGDEPTMKRWAMWRTPAAAAAPSARRPAPEPAMRIATSSDGGRSSVLYLLHGHGDSYDAWANPYRGDVEDIARGFPGLIVMPEGAQGWYADWWNDGKRADPGWERYYLDELIPLVERTYRIRKGREWHAIAGLSMGGEGSVFLAEQRPD